ncbi:MAG: DUF885 family protein [Chthoniobacterales bacterium]
MHSRFIFAFFFCASLAFARPNKSYTPDQVAAESKRANEFFDKCFDENLARHPQFESQLGIKKDYDKWDDRSESAEIQDLALRLQQLASLRSGFDFNSLDPQTQLSYRIFEREAERDMEGFKFRYDTYPINQMYGAHSEVPTFLINVHRVDNLDDAKAYIARLNGIAPLFDTLITNLETRAEKGVITPRFVFPLVLDASRKVISGQPFDNGADSPLWADAKTKIDA